MSDQDPQDEGNRQPADAQPVRRVRQDPPARMRARGSAKRSELEEARLLGFTQGACQAVALVDADWPRPYLRRWAKSLVARQERREAAKRGRLAALAQDE